MRDGNAPLALRCAAAVTVLGIASVFGFVTVYALPVLLSGQGLAVLSWRWLPAAGQFGILPMVCGSVLLSCSALLLGWPLALGLCGWLHGLGPARPARALRQLVRGMAAVPTVVYGFVSVFLLVPLVRRAGQGSGLCWLSAALVLALLVLPTMVVIMDAALRERGRALRLTGAALGLSPAQVFAHVMLPGARRWLVTAGVFGFGRAVGDTLIPLMLAGNAPGVPASPFDALRTLTAHMALVMATDAGSTAYHSLFAAGILLLGVSAGVSLAVRRLRHADDGSDPGAEWRS
ncbi:PstC family ABC transporter permease [Nitratidesulfovibrio sp. D1]|uniref:PstC family ABC transporter permease n=1 Tax=Nitratidesulfovibrio sp. D1 TaxID=3440151 RepID=UPI003EB85625